MIIRESINHEAQEATITLSLEDAQRIASVLWWYNETVVAAATDPGTRAEDIKQMHDDTVTLSSIAHSMTDIELDITGYALYKRFTKPEEIIKRARRLAR